MTLHRDRILKSDADGSPSIDQAPVGGFAISFNPDNDRFFIHDQDQDHTTLATFKGSLKGFQNARQYALKRNKLITAGVTPARRRH